MPTLASCAVSFASLCAQYLAQQPPPPPASASTAPAPKGIQGEMGDYTWKLGGYIKVDVIHDFDEIRRRCGGRTGSKSGSYYAFSVEDPDSDVLAPDGVDGQSEEPLPDLNARMYWKNELGHVQLSLFGGMARFDPDAGSPDDVFLWGTNLSTKLKAFGSDFVMGQVTYGDGVGRYRGGTTAAPDADGDLEAVETLGLMAAYQHNWSEEYRSTVTYSWGEGDIPDGAPPDANEELLYLSANLIWQFTSRAWTGIEYLYGSRDTFDGEDGDAQRVQLAVRFDL